MADRNAGGSIGFSVHWHYCTLYTYSYTRTLSLFISLSVSLSMCRNSLMATEMRMRRRSKCTGHVSYRYICLISGFAPTPNDISFVKWRRKFSRQSAVSARFFFYCSLNMHIIYSKEGNIHKCTKKANILFQIKVGRSSVCSLSSHSLFSILFNFIVSTPFLHHVRTLPFLPFAGTLPALFLYIFCKKKRKKKTINRIGHTNKVYHFSCFKLLH